MTEVELSSKIVTSESTESVGDVLASLTVRTNEVSSVSSPSLTVSVMVAVPERPATGLMITDRFKPRLSIKMFPSGTKAAWDEWPVTTMFSAAVSASATVKVIGPVGAPASVV